MAYTFPFTTAGELNLDWVLEQVQLVTGKEADFEASVNGSLKNYSDALETFVSWFPEGTFVITRDQDTQIITQITLAADAQTFQDLLDGALGQYVTDATYQADRAKSEADRAAASGQGGPYVSYNASPQGLSEAQKETARYNIGITNDLFQSKNMFVLTGTMRVARVQNKAVVVQNNAYISYDEQYQSVWYVSGEQESYYKSGTRMICSSNAVSSNIKLARGTYTVSLRVTRKNTDVVWPTKFRVGVGLAATGVSDNGSRKTYIDTFTTSNRGDEPGSANTYADENNMSAWLKATVKIEWDDVYFGLIVQDNAATGNMRLDGLIYDTIQIEQGSEVTEYVAYGAEQTAVDKEARAIAQEALDKVENSVDFEPETMPDGVSNFILDGGTSELTFCWFSDQHPAPGANFDSNVRDDISRMVNHYKSYPSSFLVDGGDWLTSSLTAATAFEQLRKIMGISKDLLPPDAQFIHLPGNHDNNSESPSDHIIYRGAMAALYGDTTTYGVIETRNCAILCVDTGSSAISTRNQEWARNEVKWFADYLSQCRKPYVIALGHEAFRGTTGWSYIQEGNSMASITNTNQALNEIARYLMECLSAMNQNAASWTFDVDGSQYFFQREGTEQDPHNVSHCLYWMAGHSHKQIVSQYLQVPILVTPNWALNAAAASGQRDTECWTYVVTKISDDGITTLFWLTGGQTGKPVHDGAHQQQSTIEINEVSWYLNWDADVTSASWDQYQEAQPEP